MLHVPLISTRDGTY